MHEALIRHYHSCFIWNWYCSRPVVPNRGAATPYSSGALFGSWATFVFQNPSRATRINNLNKISL